MNKGIWLILESQFNILDVYSEVKTVVETGCDFLL
jgi:hypothetical protein